MKPIVYTHKNPLLENYENLNKPKPESYSGFIYMWKCIPEDMFYIGSHKGVTHDEYRGSGAKFKRVFEYYGITQFKRVILEYVSDESKIKDVEQAWLNKFNAVRSNRFYNSKNAIASKAM